MIQNALCAVLVAAGRGTRSGLTSNKILEPVDGVPVIVRSLRTFLRVRNLSRIVVVAAPHEVETVNELLQNWLPDNTIWVCAGGHDRQASVKNGLDALVSHGITDDAIVLIHDAARPFVSQGAIERCIEGVRHMGASCVGVPVKDTIKVVDDGIISETPDRSLLWQVQTPQGFTMSLVQKAHELAEIEAYRGTDDAMLVERLEHPVSMVMGDYHNMKITTPEDWVFAEVLAKQQDQIYR